MTAKTLVVPVTTLDKSTYGLCAVYLCGGYDLAHNFYFGASDFFRGRAREGLMVWGVEAELGDPHCHQIFKSMIQYLLSSGRFKFQHTTYEFCVDQYDEKALNDLVWEVLAQINEW